MKSLITVFLALAAGVGAARMDQVKGSAARWLLPVAKPVGLVERTTPQTQLLKVKDEMKEIKRKEEMCDALAVRAGKEANRLDRLLRQTNGDLVVIATPDGEDEEHLRRIDLEFQCANAALRSVAARVEQRELRDDADALKRTKTQIERRIRRELAYEVLSREAPEVPFAIGESLVKSGE